MAIKHPEPGRTRADLSANRRADPRALARIFLPRCARSLFFESRNNACCSLAFLLPFSLLFPCRFLVAVNSRLVRETRVNGSGSLNETKEIIKEEAALERGIKGSPLEPGRVVSTDRAE